MYRYIKISTKEYFPISDTIGHVKYNWLDDYTIRPKFRERHKNSDHINVTLIKIYPMVYKIDVSQLTGNAKTIAENIHSTITLKSGVFFEHKLTCIERFMQQYQAAVEQNQKKFEINGTLFTDKSKAYDYIQQLKRIYGEERVRGQLEWPHYKPQFDQTPENFLQKSIESIETCHVITKIPSLSGKAFTEQDIKKPRLLIPDDFYHKKIKKNLKKQRSNAHYKCPINDEIPF